MDWRWEEDDKKERKIVRDLVVQVGSFEDHGRRADGEKREWEVVDGLKLSCGIDRYSERGGDGERWRELGERNNFVEGEETRRISDTMRERGKRKSSNFYHCWCKEGYICQEKKRIYEMTFRNGKSKIFCKPVSWRKYRRTFKFKEIYIWDIASHFSLHF